MELGSKSIYCAKLCNWSRMLGIAWYQEMRKDWFTTCKPLNDVKLMIKKLLGCKHEIMETNSLVLCTCDCNTQT